MAQRNGTPAVFMASAMCLASVVYAGGGGENVLLIVNPNDENALRIANAYTAARNIPTSNILYIDPPNHAGGYDYYLVNSADLVSKYVQPVENFISSRGLSGQIDYIATIGQPTAVQFGKNHGYSIISLSRVLQISPYLVNNLDSTNTDGLGLSTTAVSTVLSGSNPLYQSYLYSGIGTNTAVHYDPAASIPSRMAGVLAFTGFQGNTVDEAVASFTAAVQADGARPIGKVYFEESAKADGSPPPDRVGTRYSQWSPARSALSQRGISSIQEATVVPMYRDGNDAVLGAVIGNASYDPIGSGTTYLGGSYADSLTSFSARFESLSQTKATALIRAGVAGSAGSVAEPYASSGKFTNAQIYSLMVDGSTLGEAYYKSILTQKESMFLGDMLAQSYADLPQVSLVSGPADGAVVSGDGVQLDVHGALVNPALATKVASFKLYIDGVYQSTVSADPSGKGTFTLNTTALTDGNHELRLVAVNDAATQSQGALVQSFKVANHGQSVLSAVSNLTLSATEQALLNLNATAGDNSNGQVSRIELRSLGRTLATLNGASGSVALDASKLAYGDNSVIPVAVYADGKEVAGDAISVSRTPSFLAGAAAFDPDARAPGVKVEYYLGQGGTSIATSDFSGTPDLVANHYTTNLYTGINLINLEELPNPETLDVTDIDHLAMRLTAKFEVTEAGEYQFYAYRAGDSMQVLVDGVPVMGFDGAHYFATTVNTPGTFLAAGEHDLEILAANTVTSTNPTGFYVNLLFKGPDGLTRQMDGSVVYNQGSAPIIPLQPLTLGTAYTWTSLAGGNWADQIVSGSDNTADFGQLDISTNTTINLNGNQTIGKLIFADASGSHDWLLKSGTPTDSTLQLEVTDGSPTIDVTNRSALVQAPLAGNQGLTKTGDGTLYLQTANTYSGATRIDRGTLTLGFYDNGNLGLNGNILNSDHIVVNSGATFRIMNSGASNNPNRIADTTPITLNNGMLRFNYQVSSSGSAFTETIGTLNLGAGTAAIETQGNPGGSVLTFASLNRNLGTIVDFSIAGAAKLGSATNNVKFTSNPAVIGTTSDGDGLGNPVVGVLPYANVGRTQYVFDLATYDSVKGIIGLKDVGPTGLSGDGYNSLGSTVSGFDLTWKPGDNVRIVPTTQNSTVNLTNAGDVTINALLDEGTSHTLDLRGHKVTISSGVLALTGDRGDRTLTLKNGTITAGAAGVGGELIVYGNGRPYDFASNAVVLGSELYITDNEGGAVSLTINNRTNISATYLANALNTYSGGTHVSRGSLNVNQAIDTLPGTASTLGLVPTTVTANNLVFNDGTTFTQESTTFLHANRGVGIAGSVTFQTKWTNATMTINGVIADYNGIAGSLVKAAPVAYNLWPTDSYAPNGVLVLNGANTYSGTTTIGGGTLQIGGGNQSLPITTRVILDGNNPIANPILDLNGRRPVVSGLSGGPGFTKGLVTNNSASPAAINIHGTSTYDGSIRDGIAGGTVQVTKSNSGALTLTGANTHSGGTRVTGGTLIASGGAPLDQTLTPLAFSTSIKMTDTVATFTLPGAASKGVAVGQLITGPGIAAGTTITAINGDTITMSAPYDDVYPDVYYSGVYSFYSILPRTATFTNLTNTMTLPDGTDGVELGMLVVGQNLPANTIVTAINGNVLTLSNLIASGNSGSGAIYTFGGPNQAIVGSAGDLVAGQSVSGSGIANGVTISGRNTGHLISVSSTLAYDGLNPTVADFGTWNSLGHGPVTLTGTGRLELVGSATAFAGVPVFDLHDAGTTLDVSGLDAPFVLASNQTILGKGSITGPLHITGTVAPGNSIGTLNVDTLVFGEGGELDIEVENGLSDLMIVNGDLDISQAILNLIGTDPGDYTIVSYEGDLIGQFAQITGLPDGSTIDYGSGSNDVITVTLVPEPSSLTLLAISAWSLIVRRRPRHRSKP